MGHTQSELRLDARDRGTELLGAAQLSLALGVQARFEKFACVRDERE
jgi:hypothetical protein